MQPARAPNYPLRRALVLSVAAVAGFFVIRLVAGLVGGGGGDDSAAATTSSTQPASTTTTVPLVSPPPCAFGDVPSELVLLEEWQRSIVDTERRLPASYSPNDLVSTSAAGVDERFTVRSFVIDDLKALVDAAAANGTPVDIIAGYRSIEDQQELFSRREAELGFDAAAARTARPGHSEHHLGTTVDFLTAGADDVDQSWADEETGRWVLEHAHEFGFVVSYPRGGQATTCYDFEPWHYRYFGVDLAGRIHDSGLTPREYLWHWQETGAEPGR